MKRGEDQAQLRATQRLELRKAELEEIEGWMMEAQAWHKGSVQQESRQTESSEAIFKELKRGHGENKELLTKLRNRLKETGKSKEDRERSDEKSSEGREQQEKAEQKEEEEPVTRKYNLRKPPCVNTKVTMADATAQWIKEIGQLGAEGGKAEINELIQQELKKEAMKSANEAEGTRIEADIEKSLTPISG